MNNSIGQPPFPGIGKLAKGSVVFSIRAAKTLPTLILEVARTAIQTTSHGAINSDQRLLLNSKPKQIAILVPGFQLDGTSLMAFKKAFNDKKIPALFPETLPSGIDAVLFREHPHVFVEKIVVYVQQVQKQYDAEILLVGHSFGGTQALHAAHLLGSQSITPVTLSGLLEPVGLMAYAPHALYYRHAAEIFAGDDSEKFILRAQFHQLGVDETAEFNPALRKNITVVNSGDDYLSLSNQAGAYSNNLSSDHVAFPQQKTPKHYLQGRTAVYARDVVAMILEREKRLKTKQ